MLTRRLLLGSAAAAPFLDYAALAATPRDVVVMVKQIDDIISLDPAESFEFSGNEVGSNCYGKLVHPDLEDPRRIVGDLAERWDVSPDGKTYTFHLRDGRTFASGAPVTAEDAAFSFQRAVTLNKAPAFILTQFGFTAANAAERIRALDPRTLQLTITEQEAPTFLLYCLSANVGGVVEKKVAMEHAQGGDFGNAWLKTASAGSGPFVLRAWRASEVVQLEANPHAEVPPKAKRMVIQHVADPSVQLLKLRAGDADVARDLSSDQLRTIIASNEFELTRASKAYVMYAAMNQKHPTLAKPQVRQAIKWAIDYAAIAKNVVPNRFEVHQAFLPNGLPGALDDNPFQRDPGKARALLAEAGVPDGFEVTMDHYAAAPYSDIAQAIQANLADIGIKLTLIAGEQRQVITKTRARQHQVALLQWGSDYYDPHSNAQTFAMNPDNSDNATERTLAWRSAWDIPEMTKRTAAAVKETDAEKRISEYLALQKEHQQFSPFAILLQQVEVAAARKGVTGFRIGALAEGTLYGGITKA